MRAADPSPRRPVPPRPRARLTRATPPASCSLPDTDRARLTRARYAERHAQTINYAQKEKVVNAAPPAMIDTGSMATVWDIFDSHQVGKKKKK